MLGVFQLLPRVSHFQTASLVQFVFFMAANRVCSGTTILACSVRLCLFRISIPAAVDALTMCHFCARKMMSRGWGTHSVPSKDFGIGRLRVPSTEDSQLGSR